MERDTGLKQHKIVTIGGGTGHFALLDGLKQLNNPELIVAVPHTVDDGGNSGELIAEFGVLPPGDARQCALALAPTQRQRSLADLLNFRFPDGNGEGKLSGYNVGNILISALEHIHGSPETALAAFLEKYNIPGRVIPVSNKRTRLIAVPNEGEPIIGESNIDKRSTDPNFDPKNKIVRVMLESELVMNPNVGRALEDAKLIIIAPGDLFTSKVPAFLTSGFVNAWHSSKAKKVYCGDLMTKRGETDNLSASQILETFLGYMEEVDLDLIVLNDHRSLPKEVVALYREHGQGFIKADTDKCGQLIPKAKIISLPLAKSVYPRVYNPNAPRVVLRHDSIALAQAIFSEHQKLRSS